MLIVFGVLGVVSLIVGFAFYARKKEHASLCCGVSLTCVALAMLCEYLQVAKWVINNDQSALLDVVPYTYKNFVYLVIVAVVLNLIIIVLDNLKRKQ